MENYEKEIIDLKAEIEALKEDRDSYAEMYALWERRCLSTRVQAEEYHSLISALEKKVSALEKELYFYKRDNRIQGKVLLKLRADFPDVIWQYCIICKDYFRIFSREIAHSKHDMPGFIICPDCQLTHKNPWDEADSVTQAK